VRIITGDVEHAVATRNQSPYAHVVFRDDYCV
jgi:hypothetical protein